MRRSITKPLTADSRFIVTLGTAAFAWGVASVALAGSSFSVQPLLVANVDSVLGVGLVKSIDAITVNNAGSWLVEVDTDFADTTADGAVVGAAGILAREGDTLRETGGTLDSFDSVRLNNAGKVGWNLFVAGVPLGTDSGLFIDTTLILQEGFVSTAPELSAGTPYIGFFDARMTDGNELFVVASVDDPAIASSVDRALVWIDYDSVAGTFTESVIAKEGDTLPGVADAALDFGTGPENCAINEAGQALYTVSLSGAAANNGALYLDGTLLGAEGYSVAVAGLTYSNLGPSSRVDVNDGGEWVLGTGLSGDAATNQIIVKNGARFMQKGDVAPQTGGRLVTNFNTAPIAVSNDGSVFWYAALDGDAATNQGLWRDGELLIQKGVATAEGLVFTSLAGTTATGGIGEGLAISRGGNHLIFRGVLSGGNVGAFLVSFDSGIPGDIDGDGIVDATDLALLLGAWGSSDPAADLDGDGEVGAKDLAILLGAWS